jgi:hypothetical protein
MPDHRADDGQASVELAVLLPILALVALLVWQAIVAGQALWLSASAAREAARARAVGGDATGAARGVVPGALRPGLRVQGDGDGVRLRVAVPSVVGGVRLGTITVRARMEPQA